MKMITPIETQYDGYRFRSRTEARTAVFFNQLGIRYEYEKEGFCVLGHNYLPDFWLPDLGIFYEVKGDEPEPEERCNMASLSEMHPVVCQIGIPGEYLLTAFWWDDLKETDDRGYIWQGFWTMHPSTHKYVIGIPYRDPDGERREHIEKHKAFVGLIPDHKNTQPPQVTMAYRVAKQARFEHGETPQ
jgi:hypothetical protein